MQAIDEPFTDRDIPERQGHHVANTEVWLLLKQARDCAVCAFVILVK